MEWFEFFTSVVEMDLRNVFTSRKGSVYLIDIHSFKVQYIKIFIYGISLFTIDGITETKIEIVINIIFLKDLTCFFFMLYRYVTSTYFGYVEDLVIIYI